MDGNERANPVVRWGTLAALAATLALGVAPVGGPGLQAQAYELSARVWLDRGDDPVLDRGERVRLYYRTNADAFVSIFQMDTNGTVRLLFPRSPDEDHYVRGGRDYRLLFPQSTWWTVDDDPGVGYFFVVASPEPFDFSNFGYSYYQGGWDLSFVGRTVYSDPYAAMDDYISWLIPDWEYVPYALDFSSYHVERRYEYPRFLCYDCHGFRPYSSWNPYFYSCTTYRVVVYNDPYYYPVNRYRGDRVVWVRPVQPGQPRFDFKERARGEAGTPLVAARPDVADRPGVAGSPAPRRSTSGIGSGGTAVPRTSPLGRSGEAGSGVLRNPRRDVAPSGRPSDALPGRAVPRAGTTQPGTARPTTGTPTDRRALPVPGTTERTRPVLERRPPTGGGATPPGGTTRPPVVRKPTGGGSGTTPPARPTVRPGGGGNTTPPPARPTVRKPGGGSTTPPAARPTVRKPGGGGSTTPPAARPTVRPGGGGAQPPASRPVVRKPGGGGSTSSPPARPAAKPRPGGGGGGGSSPPARSTARPRPGGGGGS